MRRFIPFAVLAFGLLLAAMPLRAETDNRANIQSIISSQIVAFLNDDAEAAYAFAAPGIRMKFPDKELFFAMVRKSYQPVFRPGNYAFGRYVEIQPGSMAFQEVLITAPDGKDWTAVYKVQIQPDGSWKIGGVGMFPNTKSKGI